ncbi:hypothetical protein CDL15_Pgr018843 [Punica granatum]|uniref:Uncharacterized protein n=1 Tax=Punica granatum TaxID=22663 RepID=A0A218VW87_PUNGR|nr:hypothetical protein CDL15_Pgr018843 [Punica granatum]
MVSVNPHPAQGFYFFDPMMNSMGLSGINSAPPPSSANPASAAPAPTPSSAPFSEDPSKKVRKPYTITKSRESWTEQEHDKFLEALQLFDRDWKKIEAFVGSKTVIQIRSHAQKYFLKVQKSGTSEHVPPPRPKRKAAHPYPQKAPRNAISSQVNGPFQSSSTLFEPGYAVRPEGASVLGNPASNVSLSSWSYNSSPAVNLSQATKDDARIGGSVVPGCYSSSNENMPKSSSNAQIINRDNEPNARVMPDFAQVYRFIGSVFDPNASGQLQRLKQMDPINLETALLLMRNLCANLKSPEFEEQRKLLASYNEDPDRARASDPFSLRAGKSESAILSA